MTDYPTLLLDTKLGNVHRFYCRFDLKNKKSYIQIKIRINNLNLRSSYVQPCGASRCWTGLYNYYHYFAIFL